MKFHVTPEQVEACYNWLVTLKPFRAWNLPPADDVEFLITMHRDRAAHYRGLDHTRTDKDDNYEIAVSVNGVDHYWHLVEALCHELVHFYLDRRGMDDNHGPNFRRAARRVCKQFGWEEKDFVDDN